MTVHNPAHGRPWVRPVSVLAVAGLLSAAAACTTDGDDNGGDTGGAYPSQRMEWIVPFSAGSGADNLARNIVQIIEQYDLYPHDIVVTNIEGAGGNLGLTRLLQEAGNPYVITPTGSSFITQPLLADTAWDTLDFSPVALAGRDDFVMVVNAGTGITSLEEFFAAARQESVTVGVTTLASGGYLVAKEIADHGGYEWRVVPHDDQGQMFTSLLSNSIDAVVTNLFQALPHLESGDVVALGTSSEERFGPYQDAGLDVPTLAEIGYPTTASAPRGIIMAPDVPQEARDWWVDILQQVFATPEWKDFLYTSGISDSALFGDEFGTYLEELVDQFARELRDAGVID
jgi:putative tricarboxylic transport membrane protein